MEKFEALKAIIDPKHKHHGDLFKRFSDFNSFILFLFFLCFAFYKRNHLSGNQPNESLPNLLVSSHLASLISFQIENAKAFSPASLVNPFQFMPFEGNFSGLNKLNAG